MSFIWPVMLLSLILVPVFILLYLRMQRQRQRIAARYGSLGIVQGAGNLGLRRHLPAMLFLVSLTILLLALARPETVVSLPRVEGTVVLAFDNSGSMAADDLKPTRMEAAKVAAKAFVEQQPLNVQIGVVSFSDSGFVVQVPTYDRDEVLAVINRMKPERGTSLGNGILSALNMILAPKEPPPSMYTNLTPEPTPQPTPMPRGTYTNAVIVLLTDGENTAPPDPLLTAQLAIERGVRVHTIGIGSPAGAVLNIEGFSIHSQLNEPMLQQISLLTDGTYYNAESEDELLEIYSNLTPQLVLKPEKTEVTAIFAGVGILLLLIGGTISLLWFGRIP